MLYNLGYTSFRSTFQHCIYLRNSHVIRNDIIIQFEPDLRNNFMLCQSDVIKGKGKEPGFFSGTYMKHNS